MSLTPQQVNATGVAKPVAAIWDTPEQDPDWQLARSELLRRDEAGCEGTNASRLVLKILHSIRRWQIETAYEARDAALVGDPSP